VDSSPESLPGRRRHTTPRISYPGGPQPRRREGATMTDSRRPPERGVSDVSTDDDWVRMESDWWPPIASILPKPWPRGAAMIDVLWHESQMGRCPGRPTLAKRWGWSERRVRSLIALIRGQHDAKGQK
jgi:hypothetical protein